MEITPEQAVEALKSAIAVVADLQDQADGSVMITGPDGPQVMDVLEGLALGFAGEHPAEYAQLFSCVVDAITGKERETRWGARDVLRSIAKNLEKPTRSLYVAMSNYVGAAL